MPAYEEVVRVKEKHEKWLMEMKDVVGVGVGKMLAEDGITHEFCIKVYMAKESEAAREIPKMIDGVHTSIEITGKIYFQDNNS